MFSSTKIYFFCSKLSDKFLLLITLKNVTLFEHTLSSLSVSRADSVVVIAFSSNFHSVRQSLNVHSSTNLADQ